MGTPSSGTVRRSLYRWARALRGSVAMLWCSKKGNRIVQVRMIDRYTDPYDVGKKTEHGDALAKRARSIFEHL
jgi:hypothetical protein